MTSLSFSRLLFTALLVLTLSHCGKKKADDPTPTPPPTATATVPVINATTAPTASAVTATSATVSGSLDGNGGEAITQHGFVYSKTVQTPTLADSKTELGATTGPFPLTITSNLTGLEANTTYYVRPYATNAKGTGYGAVGQLKTEATGVAGEITGTWVEKAKFPVEPRGYNYHLVSVNGKIYLLCGGRTRDGGLGVDRFYDAWEYDPATDKWTQKAKTPITYSAIFFPQTKPLVANGKIFFPSAVGPTPFPNDIKTNIHGLTPSQINGR